MTREELFERLAELFDEDSIGGLDDEDMADQMACVKHEIDKFERSVMARAVRWAADAAFPHGRKDAKRDKRTTNAHHWNALQRWADRIESGEVAVP